MNDQPFSETYNFEVDAFENGEHVMHASGGPGKPLLESCRRCGVVGDSAGRREIWSDGVIQYLCDKCSKAMGRVRFVLTPKAEE